MIPETKNFACMLLRPLTVEIQEHPMPAVGANDVLVKVESTGICGSDLHNYSHGGVGTKIVKQPLIIGHESAGTVVEVGSSVKTISVGDRVAIEPTIYCRRCYNCKTGKTNICRFVQQASMPHTHGTLAQYYACDADFVVKIPDSISWEIAGCIQPLAVAVQLARRAKFSAGQTVAIFGCGPLGCMVMALARAHGVSKIIAVDLIQKRVDFAKKHWADYTCLPPKRAEGQEYQEWADAYKESVLSAANVDTWGVDIAVEASGAEECIHAGVTFIHPGGTYVQAGMGKSVNSFPTFLVVAKEINVVGTVRYTAGCFQTAIDLLSSGRVDIKSMVTAVYPLSQSREALEAVRRGEDLKIVIMNQQA